MSERKSAFEYRFTSCLHLFFKNSRYDSGSLQKNCETVIAPTSLKKNPDGGTSGLKKNVDLG